MLTEKIGQDQQIASQGESHDSPALFPDYAAVDSRESLQPVDWKQVWEVTRAVLLVFGLAVWMLLILQPGVEAIRAGADWTIYLPYMLISLALMGAQFMSHNLRAHGHQVWFLFVMLMMAGWM